MIIHMYYHLKLEIKTADMIRFFSSKQTQLHKMLAQMVFFSTKKQKLILSI